MERPFGADAGGEGAGESRSRMDRPERGQRALLAVAVTAALVSTGGLAASSLVRSSADRAAQTAPPPATLLTSPVVMKVLNPSVVLRGRVYPATRYDVVPTASSADTTQLYLSGLAVKAGDRVENGRLLAEVSGQPLFVLTGAVPAYRDLKPGATGSDVTQLQGALSQLGFPADSDRPGVFGSGTAAAVSAFYRRLGYQAPTTGSATQQAVDAAAKAVDADQRNVDRLTDARQNSSTADSGPGIDQQLATARSTLATDQAALAKASALNGPMVPAAQVVFLPALPAEVTAVNGAVGSPAAGTLLSLSCDDLALTGQLTPAQAASVKTGMAVEILDEAGGTSFSGTVTDLGPPTTTAPTGRVIPIGGTTAATGTAAAASPAGPASTAGAPAGAAAAAVPAYVPVTITPSTPFPAPLNGRDVRITVRRTNSTTPVPAVPVAAVSTTASGRTSVMKVDATGARTAVTVKVGATVNGFVAVTPIGGRDLQPGDQVVVGR